VVAPAFSPPGHYLVYSKEVLFQMYVLWVIQPYQILITIQIILYLSYFYKHHELSLRLGFFWTAMSLSDICAALLAYGLLHLRGVHHKSGWRWLFLIEGLLTLVIGIASFILMPASPTQTASKFRGKKGWFTARYVASSLTP
jgi:sugar phosphate permease